MVWYGEVNLIIIEGKFKVTYDGLIVWGLANFVQKHGGTRMILKILVYQNHARRKGLSL